MSVNGSKAEVKSLFIAAGCNRIVNNVSWGASGLVSFGAQNAVAIFCPKLAQILTTLPGHKAAVNCTHWLPSNKFAFKAKHLERHYLLSGDADGTIILWELSVADNKWRLVLQLPQSHKKGVTCLLRLLFLKVMQYLLLLLLMAPFACECKLTCLETLIVGSRPMVTLSLAQLPGNTGLIALAMGGLDNKIYLYCGERTGKFVRACEVKGHTDWIRSLDFSLPIFSGELDSILLVSSSQDKGIRIWKLTLRGSLANTEGTHKRGEISLASYIKGPVFVAGSFSYQISLESLLIGHEDWVYSVQWQPPLYGGHWSPDARSILAHGYGGSFHMWKNIGVSSDNWQPQKVPSGHFAPVTDITWARYGEYMLSVSHDQLSFKEKGTIVLSVERRRKLPECLKPLLSFLKTLHHATSEKSSFPEDVQADVQVLATHEVQDNPGNDGLDTLESVPDAVPVALTEPPIEDQLAWHTLWPESHKLYGHGNELFSVCCDHEGKLVASSCKAQSATVAEIWLWQVGSWKAVGRLQSHSLTVTQMEFSHDDNLLLAVSRDRQFSVFKINRRGTDEIDYNLIESREAHKRIYGHVLGTLWSRIRNSSRDKTVKIWGVKNIFS
ncbi:hypothetical protein GQ457_18G021310 [Hibiscus cannabinus]